MKSRARAKIFHYEVDSKPFPTGVAKKCVDVGLIPNHTLARTGSLGPPRTEECSEDQT